MHDTSGVFNKKSNKKVTKTPITKKILQISYIVIYYHYISYKNWGTMKWILEIMEKTINYLRNSKRKGKKLQHNN